MRDRLTRWRARRWLPGREKGKPPEVPRQTDNEERRTTKKNGKPRRRHDDEDSSDGGSRPPGMRGPRRRDAGEPELPADAGRRRAGEVARREGDGRGDARRRRTAAVLRGHAAASVQQRAQARLPEQADGLPGEPRAPRGRPAGLRLRAHPLRGRGRRRGRRRLHGLHAQPLHRRPRGAVRGPEDGPAARERVPRHPARREGAREPRPLAQRDARRPRRARRGRHLPVAARRLGGARQLPRDARRRARRGEARGRRRRDRRGGGRRGTPRRA